MLTKYQCEWAGRKAHPVSGTRGGVSTAASKRIQYSILPEQALRLFPDGRRLVRIGPSLNVSEP
jgi:hypothetical protein